MNGDIGCGTSGVVIGKVGIPPSPPDSPHSQVHPLTFGGSVMAQTQHALLNAS